MVFNSNARGCAELKKNCKLPSQRFGIKNIDLTNVCMGFLKKNGEIIGSRTPPARARASQAGGRKAGSAVRRERRRSRRGPETKGQGRGAEQMDWVPRRTACWQSPRDTRPIFIRLPRKIRPTAAWEICAKKSSFFWKRLPQHSHGKGGHDASGPQGGVGMGCCQAPRRPPPAEGSPRAPAPLPTELRLAPGLDGVTSDGVALSRSAAAKYLLRKVER